MLTKKIIESLSIEDLGKYFNNGFLRVKIHQDDIYTWRQVIRVLHSNGQNRKPLLSLQRHDKRETFLISDLELDLDFPKSGLYNYQNSVMIVKRIPLRTPQKIVSPNTLSIKPLFGFKNTPYSIGHQLFYFSGTNLEALFPFQDIQIPSLSNIVTSLNYPLCLCRILSRNFAASIPIINKTPELWYGERIIGRIESPTKVIIDIPIFLQEAKDFFTPRQIEVSLRLNEVPG